MTRLLLIASFVATLFIAGCADESTETPAANVDVSAYMLASEPEGAVDIAAARAADNDGQEITLVGRIGGSKDPWVDGKASFTLVDLSKVACAADEGCPTPWDYCCAGDLTDYRAFVKIQDANGKVLNADAKSAFGLKELETVVVHGTAKRDEAGNLSIQANGIFVRK